VPSGKCVKSLIANKEISHPHAIAAPPKYGTLVLCVLIFVTGLSKTFNFIARSLHKGVANNAAAKAIKKEIA
jgi:hypothetical protein